MGIFSYSAAVLSHFDEFEKDILAVKLEVILLKWVMILIAEIILSISIIVFQR